jgi:cobalt-zinc-cadmium efflux system outer membrane protein
VIARLRHALLASLLGALPPAGAGAAEDPTLAALVAESLAARPELREAAARARAAREAVARAEALPAPTLSVGIQNDGFDGLAIGEHETSFLSFMLTQSLPWPGKRRLRGDVARLAADQGDVTLARVRLSTEAAVRRAHLELLLARDRLALLGRLGSLWQTAEAVARARYEVGGAPQSDVLRAGLERSRLAQARARLEAEAATRVQELNRLRGRPLDEPIATPTTLADLPDPAPGETEAEAEARSPELAAARLGARRGDRRLALARRERLPDLAVSAGVMPRGGLEPMWQLSLSIELPVLWGRTGRVAAVRESEALAAADRESAEVVLRALRQRVAERRVALAASLDVLRVFREGLLVQSRATVESTLAQYRVGKVGYAAVLEALAGNLRDEDEHLQAIAAAQRVAIARDEVAVEPAGAGAAMTRFPAASMEPTAAPAAGAMGGM